MLSELKEPALKAREVIALYTKPKKRAGLSTRDAVRAPCDRVDNVPAARRAPSRGRDRNPSVRPCWGRMKRWTCGQSVPQRQRSRAAS